MPESYRNHEFQHTIIEVIEERRLRRLKRMGNDRIRKMMWSGIARGGEERESLTKIG